MSTWDSYIDNLIAQSKDASGQAHANKACIIALDGGAKWTTNEHPCALKLTPHEAETIAKCFKEKDFTPFMTDGVHVEEIYHTFLRELDGKIVYAKRQFYGVSLQASKTAIVVGHTAEGMQQGNTNKAVAAIAEYLESLGM
ncbi:hypothetical protein ACROYT_G040276 [Oculina patagonica]